MDCDYIKYGCTSKLSNPDHVQAHGIHQVNSHLKMVLKALENEVEKNSALNQKIQNLESLAKENEEKNARRFEELEQKYKTIMGTLLLFIFANI